jgi:hypothetical protein
MLDKIMRAAVMTLGHLLVFTVQSSWSIAHGRRDRVADAIGVLGHNIVNTLGNIFR